MNEVKQKPILRDTKKLIASIKTRLSTNDEERGVYADTKEVKELRKLCVLLQQRIFGLFASLESDES